MNDRQAVKAVLLDRQDIQELQSGKELLAKRSQNTGANCSNCKGNVIPFKAARLSLYFFYPKCNKSTQRRDLIQTITNSL